ncbi:MAG: ORF6N domain-containing protein [Verrucomicrobiota bacterium]
MNPLPAKPAIIADLIRSIRGQRVILDSDLARLYGVPTKRLNEQFRRNQERFPEDFAFQITAEEADLLRSQFATSSSPADRSQIATALRKHGGRRYLPYAFTEHGALMAANILNSPEAVAMSIHVIRAFVQFRHVLATHADLARKLASLENKYDAQFKVVFDAIRDLMAPPKKIKREIGFHAIKK